MAGLDNIFNKVKEATKQAADQTNRAAKAAKLERPMNPLHHPRFLRAYWLLPHHLLNQSFARLMRAQRPARAVYGRRAC